MITKRPWVLRRAVQGFMQRAHDPKDIGFELAPVVRQVEVRGVAHHAEAGVGDDDVRRNAQSRELADDPCDVAIHGDVAAMSACRGARRAQLGGQHLELRDAARHQRHAHAALREFTSQPGANAGGSTGDEHTDLRRFSHFHGAEF